MRRWGIDLTAASRQAWMQGVADMWTTAAWEEARADSMGEKR